MDEYVVAFYTFGSFHGWASDPLPSLDEAEAFVANPPEIFKPRVQDQLVIFELTRQEESDGTA